MRKTRSARAFANVRSLAWLAFVGLVITAAGCGLAPASAASDEAEPPASSPPGASQTPAREPRERILLCNVHPWQPIEREAFRLGARRGLIIYTHDIDPRSTGIVDVNLIARGVERVVPPDFDGFCTLDIEDPYIRQLKKGIDSPEFDQAQAEMLRALRTAKSLRPRAKWSIYAQPHLPYWVDQDGVKGAHPWLVASEDAKRQTRVLATAPARLLAEMDWFAPSVYDFYPEATVPNAREWDRSYVEACVSLAKSIARGRPVMPYVCHRYHDNGKPESAPAYDLIPGDEFRETIRAALDAGADGVVWWSGDSYYAGLTRTQATPHDPMDAKLQKRWNQIIAQEGHPGQTAESFVDDCHLATLRFLAETIQPTPRRR